MKKIIEKLISQYLVGPKRVKRSLSLANDLADPNLTRLKLLSIYHINIVDKIGSTIEGGLDEFNLIFAREWITYGRIIQYLQKNHTTLFLLEMLFSHVARGQKINGQSWLVFKEKIGTLHNTYFDALGKLLYNINGHWGNRLF